LRAKRIASGSSEGVEGTQATILDGSVPSEVVDVDVVAPPDLGLGLADCILRRAEIGGDPEVDIGGQVLCVIVAVGRSARRLFVRIAAL